MASNSILVIGGGFAGLTAALEAAEIGHEVFIVEKTPFLGGRVMQLNKCSPSYCPRHAAWKSSISASRVLRRSSSSPWPRSTKLAGSVGNYDVTVKIRPRFL